MAARNANSQNGRQVRVRLSTHYSDLDLPQQTGPILIPTSFRRQDLSTLVNELLETEDNIALEFSVRGYPIRSSLEDWLSSSGTSAEDLLEIDYARAQFPPQYQCSFVHDDIIGAVDILSAAAFNSISPGHERVLSASYDGSVRVWNMSGNCLARSEGTQSPDEHGNRRLADGRLPMLTAGKFLSSTKIVASGWRSYLRIWDYQEHANASTGGLATLQPVLDLYGHSGAVNDLATAGNRILSAATDGTAMLWHADAETAPEIDPPSLAELAPHKRRRIDAPITVARGPLTRLKGHGSKVTGVAFRPQDVSVAYSAAQDSTVRTWDLETSVAVQIRTPGGPHTMHRCLYAMGFLGLIVIGTSDRRILLMDPRENAARQSIGTLIGHRNAVVSLDGEPGSHYGICSGSHDGCVRVWDIRVASDASVHRPGSTWKIVRQSQNRCDRVPGGEDVSVHSVRWDSNVGIVSGGADRRVQVNRVGRGA